SDSSWNSGSSGYSAGSCNDEECRRRTIIVVCSVIGGIFVLPFLLIGCIILCLVNGTKCVLLRGVADCCRHEVVDFFCYDLFDYCRTLWCCESRQRMRHQSKVSVTTLNPPPCMTEPATIDQYLISTQRLELPAISHHKLPPITHSELRSILNSKYSFTSSTILPPIPHSKASTTNVFQSGFYNMRYYQYFKWHGPFLIRFEFNNGNVQGNGTDDVGSFDVTGCYSVQDNHMTLTKQYQRGTGDPHQNLGHQVKIDLKWNDQAQKFDGQWVVRTANYSGQDKFELKL
ncbi:unnamed protein product, partial [Rotaria sp. Silwood2]